MKLIGSVRFELTFYRSQTDRLNHSTTIRVVVMSGILDAVEKQGGRFGPRRRSEGYGDGGNFKLRCNIKGY